MTRDTEVPARAARAWALVPFLVFALLFAATFKRWVLPFQDSGRELGTALRIARGEALYRDVGYSYGPLPAFLDAALVRAFGREIDPLIALRTAIGLLGVEALRRLARRLAPDDACASAVTSFIVAACFFDTGGAYPFPYSAAALEGTVGTWWALELALSARNLRGAIAAGLLGGLAGGCKLEVAPAAVAAVAVTLALRRPRGEATAGAALAAALAGTALVAPVLLYGRDVMTRHGFLLALAMPQPLRELYERSLLFGGTTALGFRSGGWKDVLYPSAVCLGAVLLVLTNRGIARFAPPPLAFAAGLASRWSPRNAELHVLLPLAAGIAVFELGRAARARTRGDAAAERCGLAVAMLPALARQPFFLRNLIYGAFAAPLALLTSLTWIARRVAARRSFTALLFGLACAQGLRRWDEVGRQPVVWTRLPGASLYLPKEESAFLTQLVETLPRAAGPGGYAATFPEPGFVSFVTGLNNPFVDEAFMPGQQDVPAQEEMVRALRMRKPALVFTNRPFPEYGTGTYGAGILDLFLLEVGHAYLGVAKLGGLPLGTHRQRHASEGLLLVPAERVPPALRVQAAQAPAPATPALPARGSGTRH
jgi:hypothetical protein